MGALKIRLNGEDIILNPNNTVIKSSISPPSNLVENEIWWDEDEEGGNIAPSLVAYDISGGAFGKPASGAIISLFVSNRRFAFPPFLVGSVAHCLTEPSDVCSFPIKKNGVEIGYLFFDIGDSSVSGSVNDNIIFEIDDVLTITAPVSQDTSLANLTFTLAGVLL